MTFMQSTEVGWADVDIPDASIDFLATDIVPDAGGGHVDPLMVPPDAPVGAGVAHLEAVGIRERWQCLGPGAWGGVIAGSGCVPVERLMRPRLVELVAEVGERLRLGAQVGVGRSGGFGLQRAMPALVTTVLLGFTGCDELRQYAPAHPPRGQRGQPGQGVGGKRYAVVGTETPRQAECLEDPQEYWAGLRDARR